MYRCVLSHVFVPFACLAFLPSRRLRSLISTGKNSHVPPARLAWTDQLPFFFWDPERSKAWALKGTGGHLGGTWGALGGHLGSRVEHVMFM